MKFKALGAAGTVTGSSYVLTSESGQSILIDLGMFQGPFEIEKQNYELFDYDCSKLSAAFLTHAHLDHSGRLPILLTHGFQGQIWMTEATKDLIEITLYDSAKIAEKDRKKALYDDVLVAQTLFVSKIVEFEKSVRVGDFEVVFKNAGHLLGAASLVITDHSSTSEFKKIVFSGDLGNLPEDLLKDRALINEADVVVMESTYGDRLHEDNDPFTDLKIQINAIEALKSTLLVPAFSLEKTQELLHIIKHLKLEGKVSPTTPIFLDSPMAQKATDVYYKYKTYFNDHLQTDFEKDDPFVFPGLEVIQTYKDSQKIQSVTGAKVIIAGAGMMTGGRIVSHAAYSLGNPQNRIFFVGYQGEDTLGREILEGSKRVVINKQNIQVKAGVFSTKSMSSHADQKQLMDWLSAIKGVKKVILTHGEDISRSGLAQKITADLGIKDIMLPFKNQEIQI